MHTFNSLRLNKIFNINHSYSPFSFGRQHIFLLIWFVFPSQIKAQSKWLSSRSYFSGIPLISISYPIKDRTSDFRIKMFPSYVRSLDFQTSMQLFIFFIFSSQIESISTLYPCNTPRAFIGFFDPNMSIEVWRIIY